MIFSVFRKPARLRAWGLALFLTVWPWGLLQAEEAALNGQAVVAAPDSAVPAAEVGEVVKLRGVVAFVSEQLDYFYVMVGSRAESFRLAAPLTMPGFGQEIEVDYRETSLLSGGFDALAIQVIGQGQLPEPTVCTPDDILAGRYNRTGWKWRG